MLKLIIAYFSAKKINPQWVSLNTSRGFESYTHKLFMRYSGRLMKIGTVVIATFGLCWLPYLSDIDSALQVLHRLFPFARGLYEDKVANVWCSLSILIKFKQILTVDKLISLCLGSTLLFLLPSSIDLLIRPNAEKFKLSLINSSLVFFLFSFQVHEKSIIIVALVVCLQILERPFWCVWFSIISTFR
ncbi:hypothetical protein KUTeg_016671 [Tegillarca granosa]|uniref:Alpha-1,3-glucosyltransferase n=1 Tax=Tegillarca granosa TaxID=220873 RepID=A0ABQ9ELK7_TEGGR|nr:hypothetical protein KUTeg_016671 [Tegillarca granosa]